MITGETSHILIGRAAIRARAADFDNIFCATAAPATGRWPCLHIWMQAYPEYEPWGVLIKRGADCVAGALLTRRWFGLWRIGKPTLTQYPQHLAAIDSEAAHKLSQAIYAAADSFGGPWRLVLANIPATDPVLPWLQSCWPHSQSRLTIPAPQLLFEAGAPLSTYLSRNTRSAVAKARNRIARDGIEMSQVWNRDGGRICELLPDLLDISRRRQLQLGGKSLFDDEPALKNFFAAFVTENASSGLIDLLTLHLNGELAAFALCVLDNAKYWVLANYASPDWLRYSPGTIVNAEVVRHAFESPGVNGVNWGAGIQRYKLSGKTTMVHHQTIYAWSSATVRLLTPPALRSNLKKAFRPGRIRESEKPAVSF